jgi:aryl-phospho-beta-D-glucosidase BglC (GH1 family)
VGNALVADFVNVVWRMQLLGFNTIRLPFSFSQFESAAPKDPKYGGCNPADPGTVAASVTPPGVSPPPASSLPKPKAPLKNREANTCNEYLPPAVGLRNRFFWAMRYIAANGFYVIIDDHLAYDTLALDNEDKWVASWKALAADIGRDPVLRGKVMLDILNEPDSRGIKWSSGHPRGGGMARLYERAMDAIHAASPASLMLIEGTGQLGTVAMNWGDGFATQPAVVKAGGVDDARPFFASLARKPYLSNVVISPHYYPPTISTHREPEVTTGKGLQKRIMNSWGYLTTQGFNGHKFPVVIGETGSRFTDPADAAMMADFAGELRRLKAGVVYWCWNANSGDTGGIVKDDWIGVNWEKVAWMQKAVGLHPWALGSSNAAINPGAAASSPPSQYGANPAFNQGANNGAQNNNNNNNGGGQCWDEAPRGADGQAFSCQQQKDWGKCGEGWMTASGSPAHGWCAKTCGRC